MQSVSSSPLEASSIPPPPEEGLWARLSPYLEVLVQGIKEIWQRVQFWNHSPFDLPRKPYLKKRINKAYTRLQRERVTPQPSTSISRDPVTTARRKSTAVETGLQPIEDPALENLRLWALDTSNRALAIKVEEYLKTPGTEVALENYRKILLELPKHFSDAIEFLVKLQKDTTPLLTELRNAVDPAVKQQLRESQRDLLSILVPTDEETCEQLRQTLSCELENQKFDEFHISNVLGPLFSMEVSDLISENNPEVDKIYDAALLLLIKYKLKAIKEQMAASPELQNLAGYVQNTVVQPNMERFVNYGVHRVAAVIEKLPFAETLDAVVHTVRDHITDVQATIGRQQNPDVTPEDVNDEHLSVTDQQLHEYSQKSLNQLLNILLPESEGKWGLGPLFELLILPPEVEKLLGEAQDILDHFIGSGVIANGKERLEQILSIVLGMARSTLQWQVSEHADPLIYNTIKHYSKPEELRSLIADIALPLVSEFLIHQLAQKLLTENATASASSSSSATPNTEVSFGEHFYNYLTATRENHESREVKQEELVNALWDAFKVKYREICRDSEAEETVDDTGALVKSIAALVTQQEFAEAMKEFIGGFCRHLSKRDANCAFSSAQEVQEFINVQFTDAPELAPEGEQQQSSTWNPSASMVNNDLTASNTQVDPSSMAAARSYLDICLRLLFDIGEWKRNGNVLEKLIETTLRSERFQNYLQLAIARSLQPYRSSPRLIVEKAVTFLNEKTEKTDTEDKLKKLMEPRGTIPKPSVGVEGANGRLQVSIAKVGILARQFLIVTNPRPPVDESASILSWSWMKNKAASIGASAGKRIIFGQEFLKVPEELEAVINRIVDRLLCNRELNQSLLLRVADTVQEQLRKNS